MGFFGRLFRKSEDARVRSLARGVCRTMDISARAFVNAAPGVSEHESYKRALEARPYWKRENENSFVYKRGNVERQIGLMPKQKVPTFINRIVGVELAWVYAGHDFMKLTEMMNRSATEIEKHYGVSLADL